MDQFEDAELQRTLGALVESVRNLTQSLVDHKADTKAEFLLASAARKEMHEKIKVVAEIKEKMEDYEPDLKRCRIIRHFGMVVGAMIIIAAPLFSAWESVVHLWHLLTHKV